LHRLGTPRGDDPVVYEEADEAFFVGLDKTSSEAYLLISTGDHVTSEIRCLPAEDPTVEPRLVAPRRSGHEYSVDHGEGWFYVMSNATHKNFALFRAPEEDPQEANWETLVA